MRAVVARNLEGRGINLHAQTNVKEIVKTDGGLKVYTDHGEELEADVVMLATGHVPNSSRLNLENVGVELDQSRAVKVDEYSWTNVSSIWAIGDVTNRMKLTPVAVMEGTCFAKTVFDGKPTKPYYSNIPCEVFSEEEAVEKANGDTLVFTSTFNTMKNNISGRQEKSVLKLVVDVDTDKILGASMCGQDAAEIMQGIAIALKCRVTKAQFDSIRAFILRQPKNLKSKQLQVLNNYRIWKILLIIRMIKFWLNRNDTTRTIGRPKQKETNPTRTRKMIRSLKERKEIQIQQNLNQTQSKLKSKPKSKSKPKPVSNAEEEAPINNAEPVTNVVEEDSYAEEEAPINNAELVSNAEEFDSNAKEALISNAEKEPISIA